MKILPNSVTLIPSIAHSIFLYKDILSMDSLLVDAIHDNYLTYDLLRQWKIKPFIPLNNRSDNKLQNQDLILNNDGIPICADGYEMTNWGFEVKNTVPNTAVPLHPERLNTALTLVIVISQFMVRPFMSGLLQNCGF